MSNEMKVIMENWRKHTIKEDVQNPITWGELSQKIMLTLAAEKWPRVGKGLANFGFKLLTGTVKQTFDAIDSLESVLGVIPKDLQQKLEQGSEEAIKKLSDFAKEKGGAIGSFVIDDLMGMDDSLTKNLAGFSALNIEDEYEKLINKDILKKWANNVIMNAKNVPPDTPLPNLNQKLEDDLQSAIGAHPDTDKQDIRK